MRLKRTMADPNDPIEAEDYEKLAVQVFRQLVDDYCHLQDPNVRKRPETRKAFLTAIDMVWDEDFRLLHFLNDDQLPMCLEEFLCIAADRGNVDIEAFRRYLTDETNKYFHEKNLDMFKIPEVIMICGVPYNIVNDECDSFVDYEARDILIKIEQTDAFFKKFFELMMEVICFHEDLKTSAVARKTLSMHVFETIRLNRITV